MNELQASKEKQAMYPSVEMDQAPFQPCCVIKTKEHSPEATTPEKKLATQDFLQYLCDDIEGFTDFIFDDGLLSESSGNHSYEESQTDNSTIESCVSEAGFSALVPTRRIEKRKFSMLLGDCDVSPASLAYDGSSMTKVGRSNVSDDMEDYVQDICKGVTNLPEFSFHSGKQNSFIPMRADAWTDFEHCCLVGITLTLFLRKGSMNFAINQSALECRKQPVVKGFGISQADGCVILTWEQIKVLFDLARNRYTLDSSGSITCYLPSRTVSAVQRRHKFLKQENRRGELSLKDLFFQWQHTVNRENALLKAEDFDRVCGKSTGAGTQYSVQTRYAQLYRPNCWTYEEEVILVGAVMEHIYKYGTLAAVKPYHIEDVPCGTWKKVKQAVDRIWSTYTKLHNRERPKLRKSTALGRHFKIMRKRATFQSMESIEAAGDSLAALHEVWCNGFNENNRLLG